MENVSQKTPEEILSTLIIDKFETGMTLQSHHTGAYFEVIAVTDDNIKMKVINENDAPEYITLEVDVARQLLKEVDLTIDKISDATQDNTKCTLN